MEEDNYVLTHKNLLLDGAPNPNVGKLYLEWLNTLTAQTTIAEAGLAPLNVNGADPAAPWSNWEEANVTEIIPVADIDAARAGYLDMFKQIFIP